MDKIRRHFAYGILVGGRKRWGGTVTADTMEQAALAVARRCGLHREVSDPCPCDGYVDVRFTYDGKRASVCIWARPEDSLFSSLTSQV